MGKEKCPDCGGVMIRYGKTKAGSQRWQCPACKATSTNRIDNTAKLLQLFLSWLLSGKTQDELSVSARTFRRKRVRFWEVWPIPPATGEVHRVVFVDGIRIAKSVHVLIACTEEHVIGWYLAKSENSRSWGALMRKTHERLVTARNGLNKLVKDRTLFAFLDPELTAEGPLPSMNNRLEGGINAQIRNVLRDHRDMSSMRRAKTAFWWCYMHTECPLPAAEILRVMPTDNDIVEVYRRSVYEPQKRDGPAEWGDGLVWAELHHSSQWRLDWN